MGLLIPRSKPAPLTVTSFTQHLDYVRQYRHFAVQLGDNRSVPAISNEACGHAIDTWVAPLLAASQRGFAYKRRPWAPVPPALAKYVALGKTPVRVELDIAKMSTASHSAFWKWALRSETNIVLCVPESAFPGGVLAAESWDPCVYGNLRTLLAHSAVAFAKKEVERSTSVCCAFGGTAYNLCAVIFGTPEKLAELFQDFVRHCRFSHPALEREFATVRRKVKNKSDYKRGAA